MERLALWFVWFYLFTLPWEKSVMVPALGSIANAAGVLVVLAWAGLLIARRSLRWPNAALLCGGAFVAWCAMSQGWSVDPAATRLRVSTFVRLLIMTWLVWDVFRQRVWQRYALTAYVAGAGVASLWTLSRYAENQQTYYRRYAAAGFDPNDLGLTVALAIPMALYLAMTSKGAWAWLWRAAIVLVIAAVLLTASRTALITAALAFGFALLTWTRTDAVQRWSAMALLGLLIAGAIWFAPEAARQRIATLPAEATSGTLHNRTKIWKAGVRAFKQHPLVGFGSGSYPAAVEPQLGKPAREGHSYVAHNSFLSVLVETGAIGFALFGLLLLLLVWYVCLQAPVERALWATTLLVWATGVSTLTWEHRKPTWLVFALVMCAWGSAWVQRREVDA